MTYIVIDDKAFPVDTLKQIAEAQQALRDAGPAQAEVFASPTDEYSPESCANGQILYAVPRETKKRFRTESFVHNLTGETVEVIADLSTYEVNKTNFGNFKSMRGFVRHQGREFIGYFGVNGGEENAVVQGSADDVLFYPAWFWDGEWSMPLDVPTVKAKGRLWRELEEYWQLTNTKASL